MQLTGIRRKCQLKTSHLLNQLNLLHRVLPSSKKATPTQDNEEEVTLKRRVKSATRFGRKSDLSTSSSLARSRLSTGRITTAKETPERPSRGGKKGEEGTPQVAKGSKTIPETPQQSEKSSQGSERSLSRGKRQKSDSQSDESPVRSTRGKKTSDSQEVSSPSASKRVRTVSGNAGKVRDAKATQQQVRVKRLQYYVNVYTDDNTCK